jgi:uncharacterized membrane protein
MEQKPESPARLNNIKQANKQVLVQTLTLINAAFALVAALAWNEAVKALIDHYFKAGSGLYSRFIYAIIITVFVVIVTNRLTHILQRFTPDDGDSQLTSHES